MHAANRLAEFADKDGAQPSPARARRKSGADLPRVTVALEDRRFYSHHGVDPAALLGAMARNLRTGRVVSGASTITEQLVKLAAGRPGGRTWVTKLREAVAAAKLERRLDKDEILERYLNALSYGNRLVGPEAAARAYFNKPARALTLRGSASISRGCRRHPRGSTPGDGPPRRNTAMAATCAGWRRLGMLSADEARRLADAPPQPGRFLPPRRAGHFTDLVLAQLRRDPAPAKAGGRVRTTLDPDLQQSRRGTGAAGTWTTCAREGDDRPASGRGHPRERHRAPCARWSARAITADPHQGQVNGAARPRSAGSTLKPFLYLTRFDRRLLTAASILPDTAEAVRATFADYDPQNYHAGRHLGPGAGAAGAGQLAQRARRRCAGPLRRRAAGVL